MGKPPVTHKNNHNSKKSAFFFFAVGVSVNNLCFTFWLKILTNIIYLKYKLTDPIVWCKNDQKSDFVVWKEEQWA